MVKYYFEDSSFIVEDYLNSSLFSSFLPAVSGIKGKPLWAFYANRGQCMAGFGVDSKDTPITPFDSANLCYQNIALKSFRTFLKVDSKYKEAFKSKTNNTKLIINTSNISIEEEDEDYRIRVTYSTVPNRNYAGLIRKVEITNSSNQDKDFEICDGLPIFFPHGLSNFSYKELVSLMAAYCEVHGIENKMPFVKFKTSTGDCSIVQEVKDGDAYVSITENGERLNNIVDLYNVFKGDDSLVNPEGFINSSYEELINQEQQLENKLPCAFSLINKHLKSNESITFYSIYGYFDSKDLFKENLSSVKGKDIDSMIEESQKLIDDLLSPLNLKTSNKIFDLYAKQSLLDNNLRGGFAINLTKNSYHPYYVFSRKHGDMERDYNKFMIPSTYFSSGPGNFRDVLQNRRNDLYLYPFIEDYNIKIFFNLIQVDGQNPLNVSPNVYRLNNEFKNDNFDSKFLDKLKDEYTPSELYSYLDTNNIQNKDELFELVLDNSQEMNKANFAEGYWVDHWTYLVDILDNYVSIYPDRIHELLFKEDYKYFYSLVYVEPRSEKYCYLDKDHIRQYGAIDLKKLKEECEKNDFDIEKTHWLKNSKNEEVKTNLLSKIINLILVKFSCLDNKQMGIEMECEKPGWNDAMNGLPGMFASGMSETIELIRLIDFVLDYAKEFNDEKVCFLKEQYEFYNSLVDALVKFNYGIISSFQYWDEASSAREKLRKDTHLGVSGEKEYILLDDVYETLTKMKGILDEGVKKAKDLFNGILPSYLVYTVKDYEFTGNINHLGYKVVRPLSFELVKLPLFLEASARSFKLGKNYADKEEYLKIKETNLYDKKLKFYKTSADLDNAPFEIGRVHAFTKGWLERECNFLHMTYKYLLGLLKCGLYDEFYEEMKTNFVVFMDPKIYGRSTIEHSSFIVPTCNPDKKLWGKGYFARLTGANAECLDMIFYMFLGRNVFEYRNDELYFVARPYLKNEFFENGEASITLLNGLTFKIINKNNIDTYNATKITYEVNGKKYEELKGEIASNIREGLIKEVICYVE